MIKAKHRITIIILIIAISLLSNIKVSANAGAVGVQGGFAGIVSNGTGVAVLANSGIRIHIRDGNDNKVSNTVDILHPISSVPGKGWTICLNTRFEGFSTLTIDGYGASLAWTPAVCDEKYTAASTSEIKAVTDPVNGAKVSPGTLAPAAEKLNIKRGVAIKNHLSGSTPPQLNKLDGSNTTMELVDKKWNEWDYLIEDLIDISYAEGGQAEFDPVYSDHKIGSLLASTAHGSSLFQLTIPYERNVEGKIDVVQTLASHKCVICIEPLYYGVYENVSKTAMTANLILGTPYNASQIISSGYWDPGNTYNGNTSIATHNGILWSMYLNRDLVINGTTKLRSVTADPFFSTKVDDAVQNEDIPYSVGHSFMYFQFDKGSSVTQTYDPDPDPNPVPHKAPEPPSSATPDEKKYQIVKTYMVEQSDGTRTHVSTHTRVETVPTISILQEPEYKVVEYFTSPQYYFGIHPEADVTSSLWETMKGEIHGSGAISEYHNITFDQSKSGWPDAKMLVGTPGWENPVRIGTVCSCADKKHKDDTTLYVLLVKKESLPRTSTTPINPTPPADPHGPPEPLKPGENPKDPETDYQDPDNPSEYTHFRIVKVYETELEKLDHTKEIIVDGDYTIFPTNPLVQIEEEGEGGKYSKPEQYYLTAWKISDEYPYGGPTSTESVPSGTKYEDISVSEKKSGTGTTTVDLTEGLPNPKDKSKVVTLYVRLLRKQKEKKLEDGDIIIQQSQISKTIHTNDKNIGGTFGNYSWS